MSPALPGFGPECMCSPLVCTRPIISATSSVTLYIMLWHEVDNTLKTMPEHVKSAEHHAMLRDSFCENFEKDVYESYLSANDGKPKIDKLWIRNQIQWELNQE